MLWGCDNTDLESSNKVNIVNNQSKNHYFKEIWFWNGKDTNHLKLINSTFLGNEQRNYYGNQIPDNLTIQWKLYLGSGETWINSSKREVWAGAGWTGQPLLVEENGIPYLIQGAYNHQLRKINALNGKVKWAYNFDDVVKGTGSLYLNPKADVQSGICIILQGSRLGSTNLYQTIIPSYRAIGYYGGREKWRHNVTRTHSYSRDVDASALVIGDRAYIGLENGIFTVFDPASKGKSPRIFDQNDTLYNALDIQKHGGNLVTEASPCLLRDHVYICSGAGHVYGYNIKTKRIDWCFNTGADMDGSPVVTEDSCLLIAIEKQYINGKGGILKLDPSKPPNVAALWYYPTEDKAFASWEGGVVGSVAINDKTKTNVHAASLAAFQAIDGNLYVVAYKQYSKDDVVSFDAKSTLPRPKLAFKYHVGTAISTPLFIKNRIVAAGYNGIYIFEHDDKYQFKLIAHQSGNFESTPFVWNNRIYIASRDGYLYCFGNK